LQTKKDYPEALLTPGDIGAQRGQLADALADVTCFPAPGRPMLQA
jgi:hypothetical protein